MNPQVIMAYFNTKSASMRVHPAPSWLHAMWCLYVIRRDGRVWDMSHVLARQTSSHGVGVGSVYRGVAPHWGLSGRPSNEIIAVVAVHFFAVVVGGVVSWLQLMMLLLL